MQPLLQWKCKDITYFECAFIALCIHQEVRMCRIVIYGLSGSIKVFTLSPKRTQNVCFDFFYNFV
jgi:hypothetical protein